ncbi:MAG: hypothetical protein ACXWMW_13595 [Syntrophales bacterium]
MKEIHSLLKRQIKRHLKSVDTDNIPESWARFIASVNESYWQMDEDRKTPDRSLDISSQELLKANSEMMALFQTFPDITVWGNKRTYRHAGKEERNRPTIPLTCYRRTT